MGGQPDAPEPTDPKETSAASTGTNIGTAIANANLNNYNQITPNGSLTFNQTDTYKWTDSYTGETYEIPRYTATQTLSETGQKINDQNQAAQLNIAGIANNQSGFLKDYLSQPFDAAEASKATADNLYSLGTQRLDPRFTQAQDDLTTKLSNQGIKLGSAAYDRAMNQFGQTKNDAYNQLALTGQGQAFSQAQAARNQPINEITALLSGSQVAQPNFVGTPNNQIATTDTAGLINQSYNQQMQQYNTELQQSNSMMGGLFGLGASALTAFSDRRLKTDIVRVGKLDSGLNVYEYRYLWSDDRQLGLMADEVAKVRPDAVHMHASGYAMVDYGAVLGIA